VESANHGAVDGFQLGYLAQFPRHHIQLVEPLALASRGAAGELAARLEQALTALRERGPEIVSCVWQVEEVFVRCFGERLPQPPTSIEQCETWRSAVRVRCERLEGDAKASYAAGVFVGAAEQLVGFAARLWRPSAVAPSHPALAPAVSAAREELRALALVAAPSSACPTTQREIGAIVSEVATAAAAAERAPDDASAAALGEIHRRLSESARALEAAAWGTPRASVRAWLDEKLSGRELAMRFATHHRWSVPIETIPEGVRPRVLAFDKRVLLGFSDDETLEARPPFLREPGDRFGELRGTRLFALVPNDGIDLVVLDPGSDPSSRLTVNYPREMHAMLKATARDAAIQCAVTDWSRLDRAALRAHMYWVLAGGGAVTNLLDVDGQGRPRVAVFTSEAALDAHLARQNAETQAHAATRRRLLMPGDALFPPLLGLGVAGMVVDPSGPGRTRAFNKPAIALLATA
jgi:hypothetical protein